MAAVCHPRVARQHLIEGWMKTVSSLSKRKAKAGMVMIIPSLLIICVFTILPIVYSLWMSLHEWNILYNIKEFISLTNYVNVFQDERFINALKNTGIYTVTYVPTLVVFSLLFAAIINTGFKGSGFFKSLFFIPAITSMAVIAIIFRFMLDGNIGLISIWLRETGFSVPDFLKDPDTALFTVAFVVVWRWAGFNMVILLSGLNSIPDSLYEAAEIDGCDKFRQFFLISLPLLIPSLSFVIITNLINSFQVFDPIYVMTKGGPMFSSEVLVYYIYYMGFNVFDMGYASSMAFILFIIILMITILQLHGFRKGETNGEY